MKKHSLYIVLILLFLFQHIALAEYLERDSVAKTFYIPPVEYKLNPKELIVPAGLITIGTIASLTENYDIIRFSRSSNHPKSTPLDDILQYSTVPALFLFDLVAEEKHHPIDQIFLMALSYGITTVPVKLLKDNYEVLRPNGEPHSFPSGHTAKAFIGAHIIYKEFKDSNKIIAYSGYALGTVTAVARVVHNKHWVSDVLAGAGIAILSTELAYLIYFPVRNWITEKANRKFGENTVIAPIVSPDVMGLQLKIRF
jgi:hypothetical protein